MSYKQDQCFAPEVLAQVRTFIAKMNNFLSHRNAPEYFVDLIGDEIVNRFGRNALEEASRQVFQQAEELPELSNKFTALLQMFNPTVFRRHAHAISGSGALPIRG